MHDNATRAPKCIVTITIPGGLICPMKRQKRAVLFLRHSNGKVSLFLRLQEQKRVSRTWARTWNARAFLEEWPLFFKPFVVPVSHIHDWSPNESPQGHKKMECGVYQIYLTTSKGDRRNLVRFPRISLYYSASLIGGFDIRKSLPAEDNTILRRSRYYRLCIRRFARFRD